MVYGDHTNQQISICDLHTTPITPHYTVSVGHQKQSSSGAMPMSSNN